MRFKKVFLFLFTFLLVASPYITLAQNQNVGFVETNIWYSKDPFEEGDKIKVYTLVFNPSAKNFKGTVSFFDKTTLLGKKDFTISSLSAEPVFVDWTVTVGGHQIFARIENPRLEVSAGKYEEISLANTETDKSEHTVAKKLPNVKEVKEKINETLDSSIKPIEDLKDKINEKLPPSVSKPVNSAFGFIEEARINASDSIEEKRLEVKSEIDKIQESSNPSQENIDKETGDKSDVSTEITDTENTENRPVSVSAQTPLKYVSLFFLTLLGYVLKYKILFYLLSLVIIYLIIRLIIKLFK
ncbi:MAG: hypothetical protein KBC12_01285 [Candidatus Pacebacteria bacterium]|nr:hypothetical protein [Candidatus Paceibacterota bacterium]MBP9851256.1 hypothetical protein [Candidatus Paceibacterota bacterium]